MKPILLLFVALGAFAAGMEITSAGETWEDSNGKNANLVLGQADFDSGLENRGSGFPAANRMHFPSGIAVDPVSGKVFVSDYSNNRVLRFASPNALENGEDAEAVLGQAIFELADAGLSRSRMDRPYGLVCDSAGRLWVADSGNNRVLRFDDAANRDNGANADVVLGQQDFDSKVGATTKAGMRSPYSLAIDSDGGLWVADESNNRVTLFLMAATKSSGANLDRVFGQPNATSGNAATTRTGMSSPFGVAVDSENRLWVADRGNLRVLRFDNAAANTTGEADGVLGQGSFTTNDSASIPNGSSINTPGGLAVDGVKTLWVTDAGNSRVLRFDDPANKGDGASADGMLGQISPFGSFQGLSQSRVKYPEGVALDGKGHIWVADTSNHRVLRFQPNRFQPDGRVGTKSGNQKGNGTYNRSGAGQNVRVTVKGNRGGKVFFTVENDGDLADDYTVRGTRGNRKLDVKYFQTPGGNVTGAMTKRGLAMNAVAVGKKTGFNAKVKGTRTSRGKRAGLTLNLRSTSRTDGETDAVKAKVKKTP